MPQYPGNKQPAMDYTFPFLLLFTLLAVAVFALVNQAATTNVGTTPMRPDRHWPGMARRVAWFS